jgi:hypothetical protein
MSNSIDPQNGALLSDAVRTAEEVTDGSIKDSIIGVLHANLDQSDQARILKLYDDGAIAEQTARQLLGDEKFEDAAEKTRGSEMMLSGDSSRFITE